ncbi:MULTISPECIES: sensor domain-containing diguanylate cyclase [Marinomonas]|uniref:sensor domain-containing diguanylate cyclase n=1 Tax=Marinomonas TaxID=28253 RepID=UPI001055B792|nr:diguanylate cyclase [Marinomonas sp. KMM3893]
MTGTGSRSSIVVLIMLLCGLLSSIVNAAPPTLQVNHDFKKLEQFQMGYFVDPSGNMPISQVQNQHFEASSNSITLGSNAKTTWAKIVLQNTSDSPITLYLHNPYAYYNHAIELNEVVNGQVTRKRLLDMDNKDTYEWMYQGTAVFDMTLPRQQVTTLYLKNVSYIYQVFSVELYSQDLSKRVLINQYNDITLIVGMVLALIIYNFFLFLSSRLKEHLFYACYLVSGGFWIALSYGLFASFFDVFGSITLKWNIALGTMPICLLFFMINIFETRKKYPIEHKALLTTIAILATNSIYGLFDIISALEYASTLAFIVMSISLCVTISMFVRRHPLALLFLIGHGFFVTFSVLAVLFYQGRIGFNYINSHGVGIGILLESLVLSLIIANRIRTLEKLEATQAELQLLASTDPLTQLLNRRSFDLEASALLNQDKQIRFPLSLAILDIDFFKNINDTYGHSLGDQVIVRVADVLRAQCRLQDIVARYGGEEFVILMPNTTREKAHVLAERIRTTLAHTSVQVDQNQLVNFTLSVGISEVDAKTADLQAAINQADKALYKAKNSGRNQSQLHIS